MIKIIGCVFIISASFYIGIQYVSKLKKRIYGLSQIIEVLNVLKIKLEYEMSNIPRLFKAIAEQDKSDAGKMLECCALEMDKGLSLKSAWIISIKSFADTMNLSENDVILLCDFSKSLGDTDVLGQISNIELYIQLLDKNLTQAQKELSDKSRVSLSVSVFFGAIVSILLI